MSAALNGRGHVAAPNPYRALELAGSQPFPGTPAALADFDELIRSLNREVPAEEYTAMWTLYRRGRYDEWLAEMVERGREVRAAMDDQPTAVVHAAVTSTVPDDPAAVGRGR